MIWMTWIMMVPLNRLVLLRTPMTVIITFTILYKYQKFDNTNIHKLFCSRIRLRIPSFRWRRWRYHQHGRTHKCQEKLRQIWTTISDFNACAKESTTGIWRVPSIFLSVSVFTLLAYSWRRKSSDTNGMYKTLQLCYSLQIQHVPSSLGTKRTCFGRVRSRWRNVPHLQFIR